MTSPALPSPTDLEVLDLALARVRELWLRQIEAPAGHVSVSLHVGCEGWSVTIDRPNCVGRHREQYRARR